MAVRRYEREIFADYFQIYVTDLDLNLQSDAPDLWTDETLERMLAVAPGLFAVGTARNMFVPFAVEIWDEQPPDDRDGWDQVIECGIALPSGTVIAFGCTELPEEKDRIPVTPGDYRARISYKNLKDLWDNDLAGNDAYRVQLWRGEPIAVTVVKRRPG